MKRRPLFYIFILLVLSLVGYASLVGYHSIRTKQATGHWPWQALFGRPIPTNEAPAIGTSVFFTNLTHTFNLTTTASITASWSGSVVARLNLAVKTNYSTSTVLVLPEVSDDGQNWFQVAVPATSTPDSISSAGQQTATSTPIRLVYRRQVGIPNATRTYSFLIPEFRNTKYVRLQFRKLDNTDLGAEDTKIWAQLIKEDEQ